MHSEGRARDSGGNEDCGTHVLSKGMFPSCPCAETQLTIVQVFTVGHLKLGFAM